MPADPHTIGKRTCSREDAHGPACHAPASAFPPSSTRRGAVPLGSIAACGLAWFCIRTVPRASYQGATTRFGTLSRDFHGARAIFNAVERIVQHYDAERDKTRQDLAIAQGQQRDFQARLGTEFAHEGYRFHLKELRDQLEKAVSCHRENAGERGPPLRRELVSRYQRPSQGGKHHRIHPRALGQPPCRHDRGVGDDPYPNRAQAHAPSQPVTTGEDAVPLDMPPENDRTAGRADTAHNPIHAAARARQPTAYSLCPMSSASPVRDLARKNRYACFRLSSVATTTWLARRRCRCSSCPRVFPLTV